MNTQKIISTVTSLIVLGLAVCAFALSFSNLRELAISQGFDSRLAPLLPVVIDGLLIASTLSTLKSTLAGDRVTYPLVLTAVFTLLSIGLNVAHSSGGILTMILHAIGPGALFLSTELLTSQIKNDMGRKQVVNALQRLDSELKAKREELDKVNTDLVKLNANLTAKRNEIAAAQQELDSDLNTKQGRVNTMLAMFTDNPKATQAEIAEALQVSRVTVANYLRELEDAGKVKKNGIGIKVLA